MEFESEFEKNLFELRQAKLLEIEKLGQAVYPNRFPAKQGETAIDVIAYAAQISCQLGAHIVKVKPPTDYLEQPEAKKVYEKYAVPIKTMTDRVKNVVQSAMNGRRIVIFSGGESRDTDALLEDVRGIAAGGGFGSIMGRNAFQRPKAEALKLLADVMDIFRKA